MFEVKRLTDDSSYNYLLVLDDRKATFAFDYAVPVTGKGNYIRLYRNGENSPGQVKLDEIKASDETLDDILLNGFQSITN